MTKSMPQDPRRPPEPARWPLDLAASRLPDLIALAGREGPQRLVVDGRDVAVVTAAEPSARSSAETGRGIVEVMRRCPDSGLFDRIEAARAGRDDDP